MIQINAAARLPPKMAPAVSVPQRNHDPDQDGRSTAAKEFVQ
jgi:hypothetical protein